MNISAATPLSILPAHLRPKIPYQPDTPAGDSSQYDPSNMTDKEAAKLATDLYNDGKISLHELGAIMLSHLNINEDGSPRADDVSAQSKKWNFIDYAKESVRACQSRNDAQGMGIYQHILDVLKQTAAEPGRKINTAA
ncbi:hypothetical protein R6242_20975 [Iodobacter sp. CM08]|uniref:hypothetical protein n=1 Tax=Iodobacter sp. CM08 TaxID=3085902 RepID=UPI0029829883|nr:hypothetical protein [Iodobacter sp. CM08]MDW5419048.1 hypothetical protein [Iodobacter sp. CM08]